MAHASTRTLFVALALAAGAGTVMAQDERRGPPPWAGPDEEDRRLDALEGDEDEWDRLRGVLEAEGARLLGQGGDVAGDEVFRGDYGEGFIVTHSGPNADRIPPGHLPPPGECRRWNPDLPPGQQPPPFKC